MTNAFLQIQIFRHIVRILVFIFHAGENNPILEISPTQPKKFKSTPGNIFYHPWRVRACSKCLSANESAVTNSFQLVVKSWADRVQETIAEEDLSGTQLTLKAKKPIVKYAGVSPANDSVWNYCSSAHQNETIVTDGKS